MKHLSKHSYKHLYKKNATCPFEGRKMRKALPAAKCSVLVSSSLSPAPKLCLRSGLSAAPICCSWQPGCTEVCKTAVESPTPQA